MLRIFVIAIFGKLCLCLVNINNLEEKGLKSLIYLNIEIQVLDNKFILPDKIFERRLLSRARYTTGKLSKKLQRYKGNCFQLFNQKMNNFLFYSTWWCTQHLNTEHPNSSRHSFSSVFVITHWGKFKIIFRYGYFSTWLFVKHNISLISKLAVRLQCTFELIWPTNFVGLNLSSGLVPNAKLARTNFCQQCFCYKMKFVIKYVRNFLHDVIFLSISSFIW